MKLARTNTGRTWTLGLAAALALLAGTARSVLGQGFETPPLNPAVKSAMDAPYLKPEEARALRVFHGQANEDDVQDVASRAKCALLWGAYSDSSLSDEKADAADRAEAALERGEPARALALLDKNDSARAVRVRVAALEMCGRRDEAVAAGTALLNKLTQGELTDAASTTEAVRVAAMLDRVRGSTGEAGADHQAMMKLLAQVRDKMDRLYWPAMLVEAELLIEKDNYGQAQQALEAVLAMCPSSAQAWGMLGQMAVMSFDVKAAEEIAAELDEISAMPEEKDAEGKAKGVSPQAAAVRVRSMLRTDAPDQARAALKAALERFPDRRELREHEIMIAAAEYDYPATDDLLKKYDALVTASGKDLPAGGLYMAGKALSDLRQYGKAAEYLEKARDRSPKWTMPVIELGLLEMQSGRDKPALDNLELAAKMDPFNVRVANSLKLIREVISFTRVESDHFVVRAKPGIDVLLATEMLPSLEENFRAVTGKADGGVDFVPAQKTLIDLMPDHKWFAVRIAGVSRIHTIAASTGPIIAMETPREGKGHTGTYDWQRVVRHEYTHTVGLARTGNRIPHWFTEAQAVYLEHAPRDYPTCQLLKQVMDDEELFDFTKINISFTRPEKPTDRQQAYAQGHWMYEYMLGAFGERAPLELMDKYAKGVREEQAFQEVLGKSRDEFMEQFKVWANEQLVAWGMTLKPNVPKVSSLLVKEAEAKAAAGSNGDGDKHETDVPKITLELVNKWLVEYPDHPDLLEIAVRKSLEAAGGEVKPEMAPLLERYAVARPMDPLAHKQLARLYLAGDEPAKAIEHLEYLDAREDRTPTYAAELAGLYQRAGNLDNASAKAERATRVAPYVAEYRELAATVAVQRKDYATAKRHLEFLAALEPDRAIHKQRLEALEKMAGK